MSKAKSRRPRAAAKRARKAAKQAAAVPAAPPLPLSSRLWSHGLADVNVLQLLGEIEPEGPPLQPTDRVDPNGPRRRRRFPPRGLAGGVVPDDEPPGPTDTVRGNRPRRPRRFSTAAPSALQLLGGVVPDDDPPEPTDIVEPNGPKKPIHFPPHLSGHLLGMGYMPDRPDHRDFSIAHLVTHSCRDCTHLTSYQQEPEKAQVPAYRTITGLPPITHQGAVQSCTAHAVLAMAEHHIGRTLPAGSPLQPPFARLFLYKVAREILGVRGDVGCTLRESVKAMRNYGCLPEEEWPPIWANLERMPAIPDLEAARRQESLSYCRLDQTNQGGGATLRRLLHSLADGYPVAFGFSLFDTLDRMSGDHIIPLPTNTSRVIGAHAVLAIGYRIHGPADQPPQRSRSRQTRQSPTAPLISTAHPLRGEILIRNSWGPDWANQGHAWLPFDYITDQLSYDFWAQYTAHPLAHAKEG